MYICLKILKVSWLHTGSKKESEWSGNIPTIKVHLNVLIQYNNLAQYIKILVYTVYRWDYNIYTWVTSVYVLPQV